VTPPATAPSAIAVLGGGVSGVTTALLLQLSGWATTIYTLERPFDGASQVWRAAEFASLHATASVLPHSVRSTRMPEWTHASRAFFRTLAFRAEAGVRTQTHHEIFETSCVAAPPYAQAVDNFQMLTPENTSNQRVPRRGGTRSVAGWSFDAFFCEAPTYLRYLYRFYEAAGGRVSSTDEPGAAEHLPSYLGLGHRVLVNCTGLGTVQLLEPSRLGSVEDLPDAGLFEPLLDPWEPRIIRGHYIRVNVREPLLDERGRFLSYNYTPTADIYPTHEGRAGDVYCYPRSDCWVLGGSRQVRVTDRRGERWLGETGRDEETFDRGDGKAIAVPRPIFTLNAELIERISGGAISLEQLRRDSPGAFSAGVGFRFERSDPEESVRVGCSRVRMNGAESAVVHNYGHGGAGFTLSWGCALEVLEIVARLHAEGWIATRHKPPDLPSEFRTSAQMLRDLLAEVRNSLGTEVNP